MPKTGSKGLFDASPALQLPRFSAGEVAEFLDVEAWRLQKFLNSPQFRLSSAGQLVGKGRGSRRTFSESDLYLIGLTAILWRDGFSAKLIGEIVEYLHDSRLIVVDEHGSEVILGIALRRGAKGPSIEIFQSGNPPRVGVGASFYYAVDLYEVIKPIRNRMENQKRKNQ